jgi:hypothetical protein
MISVADPDPNPDPDQLGSASFCRIRIGIQCLPIRIRIGPDRHHFVGSGSG